MNGATARRVLLLVILLLAGLAPGGCFYALDGSLVDRAREGGADGPRGDGGADGAARLDGKPVPDGPQADAAPKPDGAASPDQHTSDAAPGG